MKDETHNYLHDEEYHRESNKPYGGNQFSTMNWKRRMREFERPSNKPTLKTKKGLSVQLIVAITNLCYWLLLAITIF